MSLSPGNRLGPYEILASIGAGGMGEVWKARDPRLDRIVAIKTLKGGDNGRFQREARAIAALNHPHICQIYDVGPDYLVMEYIEGQPLRGPVPREDALRIAVQIAGALEAAHKRGILHRDLKPANVLVTHAGVKLLDFGLAKMNAAANDDETAQTVEGSILGTAAYMSPEQAQGKPLDARSDMFSFGAVLYEIFSGQRAFPGDSMVDVLSAVMRDDPAPIHSSAAAIVSRCLAKQPDQRFQSMMEVKDALERLTSGKSTGPHPSIAVLPFANMSRDPDDEFFSDGLAEEILNLLAKIQGLKVIARTSSFAFRGKEQDITKIAEALRVHTVLEGSVRRSGSRIRVTAQLIDATDGSHLWSERYDRELADIFAVQDEIAAAIAGELRGKLAGAAPRTRAYKPALPAYEAFLKGRYQMAKYTPEGWSRARQFYEQAIALDGRYLEPRMFLAEANGNLLIEGLRTATEMVPVLRAEAAELLELDDANATANYLLGFIAAAHDYDWREADTRLRRAIAEAPQEPRMRIRRGGFYSAPVLGDYQDALNAVEKAVQQDPLLVFYRAALCHFLVLNGMHERAATEARTALEIDDHWLIHYAMAESYAFQGLLGEAFAEAKEAHRLAPWQGRAAGILAGILHRMGRTHEAGALLTELAQMAPFGMVLYHLLVCDIGATADSFEKSIEQRDPFVVLYARAPILRPVRESPRWPSLARMMNLPETI